MRAPLTERQPSEHSSKTLKRGSLVFFRKPTLGDKLQKLALIAPAYLKVIDQFVDVVLKRVDP